MKAFGDKMEPGDDVVVRTWAYTLSTRLVRNAANLVLPGARARIERVVGRNAVVVRFENGNVAPTQVPSTRRVRCEGVHGHRGRARPGGRRVRGASPRRGVAHTLPARLDGADAARVLRGGAEWRVVSLRAEGGVTRRSRPYWPSWHEGLLFALGVAPLPEHTPPQAPRRRPSTRAADREPGRRRKRSRDFARTGRR